MDSSNEILEHILKQKPASPSPITYSFLAPNLKGLANATTILQAHPDAFVTEATRTILNKEKPEVELAVFAAATESFSQKNLNCSVATSLDRFRPSPIFLRHTSVFVPVYGPGQRSVRYAQ